MRICQWKAWERTWTRVKGLFKLGTKKQKSYEWGNSSKGYCRVSYSPILQTTMTNNYFGKRGYRGFYNTYHWKTELQQKNILTHRRMPNGEGNNPSPPTRFSSFNYLTKFWVVFRWDIKRYQFLNHSFKYAKNSQPAFFH